ncbi:MAG TPA: CRTAC1 family protein, partial [Planctomycetota bacterium]|nr:CRTAC1 family protein [Planctomycetota bacterium]
LAFYRRQPQAKNLTFVDEGPAAGLSGPTFPCLTFGVLLQDLDLDGRLDLAIANGHIEPTVQEVLRAIPYAQKPQVFRNRGDGAFEDCTARAGPAFGNPSVGRGLAWLDHDGDGDADLVLTENGRAARLLRNDAPPGRRSLRIRLRGLKPNLDALGAVVTVTAGGRTISLERASGGSYLSESEPTLLFGLGETTRADSVKVRWPGRGGAPDAEQDLGPLDAGLWTVAQGEKPLRAGD